MNLTRHFHCTSIYYEIPVLSKLITLQRYDKLHQHYIITEKPAELKRLNCSGSICVCANAACSCFVSPDVAKIHVSLWQPPLPKAGKIMSRSCIKTFRCSRTPPTTPFSSTHHLFHFPHRYFFLFLLQRMQKDLSLFAYARYSSECFHPPVTAHRVKLNEWKHCFARF